MIAHLPCNLVAPSVCAPHSMEPVGMSAAAAAAAASNMKVSRGPGIILKKPTTPPQSKPVKTPALCQPLPVKYLLAMFAQTESGQQHLQEEVPYQFPKPTETEISAYDIAVVRAIRNNDVAELRRLKSEGKTFDACNQFGESIMHMACRRGNLEVVTFLTLEAKANISVRDDFGRTPLHDACWTPKPNFEVMDMLLRAAPPQLLLVKDVRGHTPFHYARREHWNDWVDFLRQRGPLLLGKLSQPNL